MRKIAVFVLIAFLAQHFPGGLFIPQVFASNVGDYNGDGITDAADYVVWRKFSSQPPPPDPLPPPVLPMPGDGNGDGVVNDADYNIWRGNFGNAVQQTPPPVILDTPGIWSSWQDQNENILRIHVRIQNVPEGECESINPVVGPCVVVEYRVGQQVIFREMQLNPTGEADEYVADFVRGTDPIPQYGEEFNVIVRVYQDSAELVSKAQRMFITRSVSLVIDPSDSATETRATIRGDILNPSPNMNDLLDIVEIRIFYWKEGTTRPAGPQWEMTLRNFKASDFTVFLSDLLHDTEYDYAIEAWDISGESSGGPARFITSVEDGFHTLEIHPVLSPRSENEGQTTVDIFAPIVQKNGLTQYDIAEAWLYIWEGPPGTERQASLVAQIKLSLAQAYGTCPGVPGGIPVFRLEGCLMDDGAGNLVVKYSPIHLTGLEPGTEYNYQFEVRTAYDDPSYGSPLNPWPTGIFTFQTNPIDPIIRPYVANRAETEVWINVGNPLSYSVPDELPTAENKDITEFRVFIWEQGSSKSAQASFKCSYEDLETGKCAFKKSGTTYSSNGQNVNPWEIYVEGLSDNAVHFYEIEAWLTGSGGPLGSFQVETTGSAGDVWLYDVIPGPGQRPGTFTTYRIDFELEPFVNQSTVTETDADLATRNLVIPLGIRSEIRRDIAVVEFCYKKTSDDNFDCETVTPMSLEDLENAGWKTHVDDLAPGTPYQYKIQIWKDVDVNGVPDGGGMVFDSTELYPLVLFTTDPAAVDVTGQVSGETETTAHIVARVTDETTFGMSPEFISLFQVSIQYWETNDELGTKQTRTMSRDLDTPDPLDWEIDLTNLNHNRNYTNGNPYTYRIIVSHPDWPNTVDYESTFETLEMDFELRPFVNQNTVTETEADFEGILFVIPLGIRQLPDIKLDIAVVRFCYREYREAGTLTFDCTTIDPILLSTLRDTNNWKIHVSEGLNHDTDYEVKIEIWTAEDHDTNIVGEERIFDSVDEFGGIDGIARFTTDPIAPQIIPRVEPLEMEADFLRARPITNLPLRPGIVEARLFIWEDVAPRPTAREDAVQIFSWSSLDQLAAGQGWHFQFLKPDFPYRYQIEFWTNIPDGNDGYFQEFISEIDEALYQPEDPTPGLLFHTLPINPVVNPCDAGGMNPCSTTETEVDIQAVIDPASLPDRWDILKVRIFYWKDGDPEPPSNSTPKYEDTLLNFFQGHDGNPWTAHEENLDHDTTYHYRIEIWTSVSQGQWNLHTVPVSPQPVLVLGSGAGPDGQIGTGDDVLPSLSFTTLRFAPAVIPRVEDITHTTARLMLPITNLPIQREDVLVEVHYQTVSYEHQVGPNQFEDGKICESPSESEPEGKCSGRPKFEWVNGQQELVIDERVVSFTIDQLEFMNRNTPAGEDWFIILEGLNHFSHYTYWIEIQTNIPGQEQDLVFDTRPGVCNVDGVCDEAAAVLRQVCVKDPDDSIKNPNDIGTCYDSNPQTEAIDPIYYDEPDVTTWFVTDRITPTIVYAFTENETPSEADIAAFIDNLPPDLSDGTRIYEVYFVYRKLTDTQWTELEMDRENEDSEWKVHVSGLQSGTNYVYQVEVRTNIDDGPGDQPKEQVAFSSAYPITTSTDADDVIYLDRSDPPQVIPMDDPVVAGQMLAHDGTFYLKLDLSGVLEYSVFATLKLTWPGEPTRVYDERIDRTDPLHPFVIFDIPTTEFPQPNFTVDGTGAIVPDPPFFDIDYELILKGSAGALIDGGPLQIPNVPPVIRYLDQNGNPILDVNGNPILGGGNLLPNLIALAGKPDDGTQVRTLTIDPGGLNWPTRLELWDSDPGANPPFPTFTFEGQMDTISTSPTFGKIVFLIPMGYEQFYFKLTFINPAPAGGTLVDTGRFEVPQSRDPDVSAETILDALEAAYSQVIGPYPPSDHNYFFELWRKLPDNPLCVLPCQQPVAQRVFPDVQVNPASPTWDLADRPQLHTLISNNLPLFWDFKITAWLAVRTSGGVLKTKKPLLGPDNNDLSYPLEPKGIPSYSDAPTYVSGLLTTIFDVNRRKAAAQQVQGDGVPPRSAALRIDIRDRNGNPMSPSYFNVPINPDGTVGSAACSLTCFQSMLAPLLTTASPSNPIFISATLVEMEDANIQSGQIVSRFSETRYWGFGNN